MTERTDNTQPFQIAEGQREVGIVHATGDRIGQVPTPRHRLAEIFVSKLQSQLAGLCFCQLPLRALENPRVVVRKVAGHDELAQVSEQAAQVRFLDTAKARADGDMPRMVRGEHHQENQLLELARLIAKVLEYQHARGQVFDGVPAHHGDGARYAQDRPATGIVVDGVGRAQHHRGQADVLEDDVGQQI